ncbi:MAG: YgiT-type zinc finger protein [Euryarchaeota archaeon]|nr:YgiT-type zinc finger protein [Euryarchaeota archaeon]
MKTCYQCGGPVKRKFAEVKIADAVVTDVYADVCQRCGEKYFDSRTATFIQKAASFIESLKKEYLLEASKSAMGEG